MIPEVPEIRDGRALIGGLTAVELAERWGTPLYVLDAAAVDASLERIRAGVSRDRLAIYYSAKANPSVALLRRLRAAGARLDACSPGDLAFGRAAGFPPEAISFTGHAMSDAELAEVMESGAAFVADSLDQLERVGGLAPGREVGLRLNCGIEAGFHPHVQAGARDSKFGIHVHQLDRALEIAGAAGLRVAGLHGHLGSDVLEPGPHLALLDALLAAGERLPDLAWVNLGGGYGDIDGERYDFETLGAEAERRLAAAEAARGGRPLELRLEPGGFLVLNAGCLLARVTELKPRVSAGGAATASFVGTDTSHNHLVSAVIYGAQHPIWIADRADAKPDGEFTVVGNLMQAGDVLATARPLPAPRRGDVLVIGRCGGYAAWRAPVFNERPRPAEVLVDGGKAVLVRRAETIDDLLRLEAL